MRLNLDKLPLGKLSEGQIHKGYMLLNHLADLIAAYEAESKPKLDASPQNSAVRRSRRALQSKATKNLKQRVHKQLRDLSSQFYTMIPHAFGMSLPPAISTLAHVQRETQLLEVLTNAEVTAKIIQKSYLSQDWNSMDSQYRSLKVELTPLEQSCAEYSMIER